MFHGQLSLATRPDIRGARCGIGSDAGEVHEPMDTFPRTCASYSRCALHVNCRVRHVSCFHVRGGRIHNSLGSPNCGDYGLFIPDIRGERLHALESIMQRSYMNALGVPHSHTNRDFIGNEPLDDTATQKAGSAEHGYLGRHWSVLPVTSSRQPRP